MMDLSTRTAAHCGEGEDRNPFHKTDARACSVEWEQFDYALR